MKMKKHNAVVDAEELEIQENKHDAGGSICRGCALGKAHRQPFHSVSSEPASTGIMNKVSADVCGPIHGENLSTIIDDDSNKVFGSIIPRKSDVKDQVMKWNA